MEDRPSNDPGHVGPRIDPGWLDVGRQVILFALGVWLIVFAATTSGHDVPFLVTGLVLFGMIPFERVLTRRQRSVDLERDQHGADRGDAVGDGVDD